MFRPEKIFGPILCNIIRSLISVCKYSYPVVSDKIYLIIDDPVLPTSSVINQEISYSTSQDNCKILAYKILKEQNTWLIFCSFQTTINKYLQ